MSDYFFDAGRARLFNEYDTPEYTFNSKVDSFIYKIWNKPPDKSDGNYFF